jgi:hypothetical protein
MILRLTTVYENGTPPSPLGEKVARDGVFISRRGPGEGVPIFMAVGHARGPGAPGNHEITCHSERSEESGPVPFLLRKQCQIPHFVRNDKLFQSSEQSPQL